MCFQSRTPRRRPLRVQPTSDRDPAPRVTCKHLCAVRCKGGNPGGKEPQPRAHHVRTSREHIPATHATRPLATHRWPSAAVNHSTRTSSTRTTPPSGGAPPDRPDAPRRRRSEPTERERLTGGVGEREKGRRRRSSVGSRRPRRCSVQPPAAAPRVSSRLPPARKLPKSPRSTQTHLHQTRHTAPATATATRSAPRRLANRTTTPTSGCPSLALLETGGGKKGEDRALDGCVWPPQPRSTGGAGGRGSMMWPARLARPPRKEPRTRRINAPRAAPRRLSTPGQRPGMQHWQPDGRLAGWAPFKGGDRASPEAQGMTAGGAIPARHPPAVPAQMRSKRRQKHHPSRSAPRSPRGGVDWRGPGAALSGAHRRWLKNSGGAAAPPSRKTGRFGRRPRRQPGPGSPPVCARQPDSGGGRAGRASLSGGGALKKQKWGPQKSNLHGDQGRRPVIKVRIKAGAVRGREQRGGGAWGGGARGEQARRVWRVRLWSLLPHS